MKTKNTASRNAVSKSRPAKKTSKGFSAFAKPMVNSLQGLMMPKGRKKTKTAAMSKSRKVAKAPIARKRAANQTTATRARKAA